MNIDRVCIHLRVTQMQRKAKLGISLETSTNASKHYTNIVTDPELYQPNVLSTILASPAQN